MGDVDISVCRLCGQHRAIPSDRHPVPKEKHSIDILKSTGVDVKADHAGCPPYICQCCVRKLGKAKKIRNKEVRHGAVNFDVPEFVNPNVPDLGTKQQLDMTKFLRDTRPIAAQESFVDVSGPGEPSLGVFVSLVPITASVRFKVTVNSDLSWHVQYMNVNVENTNPLLANQPVFMSPGTFAELLSILNMCTICSGNEALPEIVKYCEEHNETKLYNVSKNEVVAFIHGDVIRSSKCCIIMPAGISGSCESCKQFRPNLRARAHHFRTSAAKSTNKTDANSTVAVVNLNATEKAQRLKNLSKTVRNLRKKLKRNPSEMVETDFVNVSEEQNAILKKFVKEQQLQVESQFPEDSPERLFLDQQIKCSKAKSPNGMRWHPFIIKWCISIYSKSPAAYRQLSQAGILRVPHHSTLKSYINFTDSIPDINPDILKLVVDEFNIKGGIPDYTHNVCLVWDEMQIKSGLALSKYTGKLVGFCDMGTREVGLKDLFSHDDEPELATHILVLMVRGILNKVNIPFIWYPGKTFTSAELVRIIWRATRTLEDLDLSVRAWVSDGASQNRSFFSIHKIIGLAYDGLTFATLDKYDKTKHIYFICDTPHLLKTVRNNLEKSGSTKSKMLTKGGQTMMWSHIVTSVKDDKLNELHRLYKVQEEHINLSPQLRMRVKLAAQVLSSTMSNALIARNQPHVKGTAEFCSIFNKWFDCLNARYADEGKQKRNPNLEPYRSDCPDDPRYTWLSSDFLGWLKDWENEVAGIEGLSKSEKNKLILSRQTIEGLKITTVSFVSLVKSLLAEPGAKYLLPEKLNQDRLETFFAKLRRGCGDSDNPTVDQVRNRILALLVAGKCFIPPKGRNCKVNDEVGMSKSLPKRSKKQKTM